MNKETVWQMNNWEIIRLVVWRNDAQISGIFFMAKKCYKKMNDLPKQRNKDEYYFGTIHTGG